MRADPITGARTTQSPGLGRGGTRTHARRDEVSSASFAEEVHSEIAGREHNPRPSATTRRNIPQAGVALPSKAGGDALARNVRSERPRARVVLYITSSFWPDANMRFRSAYRRF